MGCYSVPVPGLGNFDPAPVGSLLFAPFKYEVWVQSIGKNVTTFRHVDIYRHI